MADAISYRTLPQMERLAARRAAGTGPLEAATSPAQPMFAAVMPERRAPELRELRVAPDILISRFPGMFTPPAPAPPPAVPTLPPAPAPMAPVVPTLSADNPFQQLPQPNPGDRIKSDDFRIYSRCLAAMQSACTLSATLFGRTLAEARPVLTAQQLTVERVMSVFGTVLTGSGDADLEQRRIVQVSPVAFGERRVLVVVTEAVETRRLTPNLMNLTYAEAGERIRAAVGDATFPQMSVRVGQLVGSTLGDAMRAAVTPNA
jgi:hypothetical protein